MLRKRSWFSLIELLVVIGIIALLASLLLPALNRAREVGKRIVCASNMGQIGVAFQLYYNDYNGRLPPGYYTGGAWHSAPEKIVQYLPHKAMTFNHTGWNETVFLSDVYKCPSDTFFPPTPPPFDAINEDFTSYGYAHVMQMYNAITIANIKTPSTTVLAGESWKKQEYVDMGLYVLYGSLLSYEVGSTSSPMATKTRHAGTGNILWADGHTAAVTTKEALNIHTTHEGPFTAW